jgi:hypothetical protein
MTEQQQHLQTAIDNQKSLIAEVNELNNAIIIKKEAIIKYQGIIEYLTGNGVKLPETQSEEVKENEEK